jgi:hypothetical protein
MTDKRQKQGHLIRTFERRKMGPKWNPKGIVELVSQHFHEDDAGYDFPRSREPTCVFDTLKTPEEDAIKSSLGPKVSAETKAGFSFISLVVSSTTPKPIE